MTSQDATTTTADLDAMLRKIRGLLAVADDDATPEEAKPAYRAKAEAMMVKFRISEEQAYESMPASDRITPTSRDIVICKLSAKYRNNYYSLVAFIAEHVGAEMVTTWDHSRDEYRATLVGFDADLRYAELLYTSAFLAYHINLEPEYDPNKSEEENIFILRNAGWTRGNIAKLLWGQESSAGNGKVQKVYARMAAERGMPIVAGRGVNRADFVEVYADSFLNSFWYRLALARQAANEETGDGVSIVLANRSERVKEAFYTMFPSRRPREASPFDVPTVDTRTAAERAADERAEAKERARWERQAAKDRLERAKKWAGPAGQAGRVAGQRSAASVNLGGIRTAGRVEGS